MKPIILTLALASAFPAFAGERTVSEATPTFDWDLCHERQDACREADRSLHTGPLRRARFAPSTTGVLGLWPVGPRLAMTLAPWFTTHEYGSFPIERAAHTTITSVTT